MHDIAFYTHAVTKTGFGHVARCVNTVKLLKKKNKNLDIAFIGEFSKNAKNWINSQVSIKFTDLSYANVVVYDRMDDPEYPENFSVRNLNFIKNRCSKIIFYANSPIKPILSDKIIIIGQYLNEKENNNSNYYFGLKFLPTHKSKNSAKKLKNNIFIALGGAKGFLNINKCMNAIASVNAIKTIDFLESPLNPLENRSFLLRADQKIKFHKNIPSIEKYLSKAGMVLASYGHLGYQALAEGAPLCLVGQKRFQAEYADQLAKAGLCISAGLIKEITFKDITQSIEETIKKADILRKNAKEKIDGNGLLRISDLIYNSIS